MDLLTVKTALLPETHAAPPVAATLSKDGFIDYVWAVQRNRDNKMVLGVMPPRRIDGNMWKRFLRLADAPDEHIRAFAERYGALTPAGALPGVAETVAEWRRFARLARAIFDGWVATDDSEAREWTVEEWRLICEWLGIQYDEVVRMQEPPLVLRAQRFEFMKCLIALAMNKWYATATNHRLVVVRNEALAIEPCSETLFGTIIVQIAHALARPVEHVCCSGCGAAYNPKRQPSEGKRRYCPECRRNGVPHRHAARDHRNRRKGRV